MQSTNYRYLKAGENVLSSDEIRLGDKWVVAGESCLLGKNTEVSELAEREMWYRRRLPHSSKVQFLMNVSILVPVVVDCDGREQEQIEAEAGELAVQKILADPTQYVHYDNIDWGGCRVDDEEFQPEPKNPTLKSIQSIGRGIRPESNEIEILVEPTVGGKYRTLEVGEIIEAGDQFKRRNGEWELVNNSIGEELPENWLGNIRRPITDEPRYRPFREGDMIEKGDQLRFSESGEWEDIYVSHPEEIDNSIIGNNNFRKLIK